MIDTICFGTIKEMDILAFNINGPRAIGKIRVIERRYDFVELNVNVNVISELFH